MSTKLTVPAVRAARTIGALAAALMLAVLLAQTAAAEIKLSRPLHKVVAAGEKACINAGGVIDVKWQGPPGKETGATATCMHTDGGAGDTKCTYTAIPGGTSVSCLPFRPEDPPP